MGPLATPKKGREVRSVDPWTPTSNLKMLISAASPEIRNREKELCMDNDERDGLDPTQVQVTAMSLDKSRSLEGCFTHLLSSCRTLKMEKSQRK